MEFKNCDHCQRKYEINRMCYSHYCQSCINQKIPSKYFICFGCKKNHQYTGKEFYKNVYYCLWCRSQNV